MATMLCTSDFDDQTQYAETDTHQSGQVDIPKYDEEIIYHSLNNGCVPHHMIHDNEQWWTVKLCHTFSRISCMCISFTTFLGHNDSS